MGRRHTHFRGKKILKRTTRVGNEVELSVRELRQLLRQNGPNYQFRPSRNAQPNSGAMPVSFYY